MSVSMEDRNAVLVVAAHLGVELTEEQIEFASDFTVPTVSFSNPGTGKSFSTIVGLIVAQTRKGVPGSRINAMSFTREATAELSGRYQTACKKCGITPSVQFNTFHSICLTIIREIFKNIRVEEFFDYEKELPLMVNYIEEAGIPDPDNAYAKQVYEAIHTLNSALSFARFNVESSSAFKKLNMTYEQFQEIRVSWLISCITRLSITRGDIPIVALYVLCQNKEIREKYKKRYQIVVIDEFQDMTLLYLKILSMITTNLVAIGDMKQQIYGFNGACSVIVEEYLKMYPNARQVSLTKSYRCKNEIAEFATEIIRRNDPMIEAFKGTDSGGCVEVIPTSRLDLNGIAEEIKSTQNIIGGKRYMILFRNNDAAIPIAETLYKADVHFRMPKFLPIMQMPIFREICTLVDAAMRPTEAYTVYNALRYFPEFRKTSMTDNPVIQAMNVSGKSILDLKFTYQLDSSYEIVDAMRRASVLISNNATAGKVLNCFWFIYEKYIIEGKWYLLKREKEYYCRLIKSIVESKTYPQMIRDEQEKAKYTAECIKGRHGALCYTMHSAKGLEADKVYILDCEDVVCPNTKEVKKKAAIGCEFEIAKNIRNERNLLYVAITRAREQVVICYDENLTPLIGEPLSNIYDRYDSIYEATNKSYDDVAKFEELFGLHGEFSSTEETSGNSEAEYIEL